MYKFNVLFLIACLCLTPFLVSSQDTVSVSNDRGTGEFTAIWSMPMKVKGGQINYAGVFKEKIYLHTPKKNGKPLLSIFDIDDMSFLEKREILLPPGRDVHEIFQFRNKLYIISSDFDKKKSKKVVYMQGIAWDGLQLEGKEKKLSSVKVESWKDEITIMKTISPDKQKIAFSIFPKIMPKKKITLFSAFVLDKNLKKIWSKRAKLKYPSDELHLENFVLNSDADLFALLSTDGSWELNENIDIDFAVVAITNNADSVQTFVQKMKGEKRFMTGTVAPTGFRGRDFVVSGLYRADDDTSIEGAFTCVYKYDDEGKVATPDEPKFVDISLPMPKGITGGGGEEEEEEFEEESFASDEESSRDDSGGDDSGNDEDEEEDIRPRIANHIVISRGLEIDERHKQFIITELMSESGGCYDFYIFSLSQEGVLEYVRPIPKAQDPDDTDFSSYEYIFSPVQDELFLVFNDMEENLDEIDNENIKTFRDGDYRSIISCVRMVGKNGDYKRKMITNKTRMIKPACGHTNSGEIILYGIDAGGTEYRSGVVRVSNFK